MYASLRVHQSTKSSTAFHKIPSTFIFSKGRRHPYQQGVKGELDVVGLSEVDVVHQQRPRVQLHEDSQQLHTRRVISCEFIKIICIHQTVSDLHAYLLVISERGQILQDEPLLHGRAQR